MSKNHKPILLASILAFVLGVVPLLAADIIISRHSSKPLNAPAGGGGAGDAFETFDTASGYDLTWSVNGTVTTVDPDYTGAVLNGTQTFRGAWSSAGGWIYHQMGGNSNTVKISGLVRRVSNSGTCVFLAYRSTSSGSPRLSVQVDGSGFVTVTHGSVNSTVTSDAMTVGTTYYFWFEYALGTGANGFGSFEFSETDTETGTGNKYTSTAIGSATAQVAYICMGPATTETMEFLYDRFTYLAP